ncbi:MAG TPA: M10 family metallopeptidase [Geminicoccaceae bacterium]|nr:M10 family metallopeptidase [Geminicoccus sp.]HMU51694.1 M10 family metallopeptidase [Geminicoccaceae bacterium]
MLDPATPYEGSETSPTPKTGDIHTDNLLAGSKWGDEVGTGVIIEYSFAGPDSVFPADYGSGEPDTISALSATQKNAVRAALDLWAGLADITFVEVAETDDHVGVMRFGRSSAPSTAWGYYPASGYPEGGDVWFGPGYAPNASYAAGTYNFATVVHEIGHALGLKHPHASGGSNVIYGTGYDWLGNSVMSYRSYLNDSVTGGGYSNAFFPTGPMLNDVAAIQYLYGTNTATRAGDTVYQWDTGERLFETIYDAGGRDRIDWSNQSTAAVIDLTPGAWSELGPAYTWTDGRKSGSYATTLAIARGSWIEDAAGGSGNDSITGNGRANRLDGNDGSDDLFGGSGDDELSGGGGQDDLVGGEGDDELWGGTGNDSFSFGGSFGDDVVHDTSGSNLLVFTDLQRGQASFADSSGDLLITFAARDVSVRIDDYYASGLDFDFSFVTPPPIIGTSRADRLDGTDGADSISGLGGNDTLRGGDDDDRISGGAGKDTIHGGDGDDVLLGDAGNDLIVGGGDRDVMTGGGGADTFDFDALGESLPGAGLRDVIGDFSTSQKDRIDLRGIDARPSTGADDAFIWRGASAFSADATGEVRYTRSGGITLIEASTDADASPEMQIELTGSITLQASHFFL